MDNQISATDRLNIPGNNIPDGKSRPTFLLCLNKFYVEHHKMLFAALGCILGLPAVIGIWGGLIRCREQDLLLFIWLFTGTLICNIIASMMFSEMGRKEGRISLLMTPASAADKFWTRFIFFVPLTLLAAVGGLFLLSLSHTLTMEVVYNIHVIQHFLHVRDFDALLMVGSVWLVVEAFYVLGAAAWPRFSFIKSTVILTVVQMLMSFVLFLIIENITAITITIDESSATVYIFSAVFFAVACGLTTWAYYIFKNSKVAK